MSPKGIGRNVSAGVVARAGLMVACALGAGCAMVKVPGSVRATPEVSRLATDPPPVSGPPAAGDPAGAAAGVVLTPASAQDGTPAAGAGLDVVATPGAPEVPPAATALASPVLIDQKVGEINGRPIRVQDILDDLGQRLGTAAQTRRLSVDDWRIVRNRPDLDPRIEATTLTREEWLRFAAWQIAFRLNRMLEDELLEAEARASLQDRERQGLKYLLQEAQGNIRRESGGSRAAAERRLGKSEQQFLRERESRLLIEHQLNERIASRARVSWKDVRLFYERNAGVYNPPPAARFRLIRVRASDTEAVSRIQAALDAGEPFERVASMPENTHHAATGGLMSDLRTFTGEYARADLRLPAVIQEPAQQLKPGEFTRVPVDHIGDKVWIHLDAIIRRERPLADRDVQLEIARVLIGTAREQELRNYINNLKRRASFSDMESMLLAVLEVAAERYWPAGGARPPR